MYDKNTITQAAQKFAARGQYDKAIAEWLKLHKQWPSDAAILNTIGDLCLKKNDQSTAVNVYMKAVSSLAAEGFTAKAISLCKKIINITPNNSEARITIGDLSAEKGLLGEALESYKAAADIYNQQNERVKALGMYKKMADLNPTNAPFRGKLAELYAKHGMKQEAIDAYLFAADVYIEKGAFQDARQLFEKVLTLDPGNREVYCKAGVAYYKEGDFESACKAFRFSYEQDPLNQDLLGYYIDALSKIARDAETEAIYNKLSGQNPVLSAAEVRDMLHAYDGWYGPEPPPHTPPPFLEPQHESAPTSFANDVCDEIETEAIEHDLDTPFILDIKGLTRALVSVPNGVLKLFPSEFAGPITIRGPVEIDGQGSTIWAVRGPVLIIESDGVVLNNMRLEVTGAIETAEQPEAQCALLIKSAKSPALNNVEVKGSVIGADGEEGEWFHPFSLNLGHLTHGVEHKFKIRITVPVPCNLKLDISGVSIEPSSLNIGNHEIDLHVEHVSQDTLLSGSIWIVTPLFRRRIVLNAYVLAKDMPGVQGNGQLLWEPTLIQGSDRVADLTQGLVPLEHIDIFG